MYCLKSECVRLCPRIDADSIPESPPVIHINGCEKVDGFRTDSRAHDMISNDEIPFSNQFMTVIEHTQCA